MKESEKAFFLKFLLHPAGCYALPREMDQIVKTERTDLGVMKVDCIARPKELTLIQWLQIATKLQTKKKILKIFNV